jgi:SPP1 gp7 family putative phage head morphogenesis protein
VLTDQSVRRAVYLERLKTGEANQFAAFLKRIDAEIRAKLEGKELTDYSTARLEKLLASLSESMGAVFNDHYDELAGHLTELGAEEARFEVKNLNSALVDAAAVLPAPMQIRAAIFTRPLPVTGADGGSLLEPFIRSLSANETKRLTNAIRLGYFEGQTNSEILKTVRGTKAAGYRDGLLAITKREAEAVVQTAVQHVANQARASVWENNKDIVPKYRWVAALDNRTCPICQPRDGEKYPVGTLPLPPLHVRCRCTTVAELAPKYAKLLEESKRASKGAEGGKPVKASLTYFDWLKTQPAEFQDGVLGKTRAKIFRSGMTAEQFKAFNYDRNFEPMTLKELRDTDPQVFAQAGV